MSVVFNSVACFDILHYKVRHARVQQGETTVFDDRGAGAGQLLVSAAGQVRSHNANLSFGEALLLGFLSLFTKASEPLHLTLYSPHFISSSHG